VVSSTYQVRSAIVLVIDDLTCVTFVKGHERLVGQVKTLCVNCQSIGPVITGKCPANLCVDDGFSLDQAKITTITKTGNLTQEVITIPAIEPGREVLILIVQGQVAHRFRQSGQINCRFIGIGLDTAVSVGGIKDQTPVTQCFSENVTGG
jgi:hypothetical protein